MAGAIVSDSLAESLAADLRCDLSTAIQIAAKARQHLPRIVGTSEDFDEDIIVRLRDPWIFGDFAAALLEDLEVSTEVGSLLVEHAFDLLPVPPGEADLILVETRAPRSLLRLALFVADTKGLTVLHVMHLVFSVFLDRGIVRRAPRPVRSKLLSAVLRLAEVDANLRSFYAAMHLSAIPEPEAHRELRGILVGDLDEAVKELLARESAAEDGGLEVLLRTAQALSLVPADGSGMATPESIANIPRLPPRLRAVGRRWLAQSR